MELFGLDLEFAIGLSRGQSEAWKVVICLATMLLVMGWRWLPRKLGIGLLGGLTLWATVNYARYDTELVESKYDTYDLMHYYLNAKYFDELGYYDLYPACLAADLDNDGPYFKKQGVLYMAQNHAGHGRMLIEHGVERGQWVREHKFTPERWDAFEHDFLVLQRTGPSMTDKLWRQMIIDHGYNGTPAWTVMARPFAQLVDVENIKLLGYLDLALLVAATGAVAWAYGGPTAMFAWLFLMVTYSVRWPTITWAFFRYDYVAALMVGMAALKKGHHAIAGLLTAFAATMRFFPAMWLYGPGMKGFAGLTRKKVHKPLLVLAGAFFVGAIAIEGATVAVLGSDTVEVHFENMVDHNSSEQLSSRRIGLALALPYRGELNPKFIEPERKEAIEAQKPLRYGIAVIVMLLLGWGLRRADDDETYALGFIPFFLLTTASYYYYVTRITLMMLHASNLKKPRNVVGLMMLLGIELFGNWAESVHGGHRVYLIGSTAWMLSAYVLLMTLWFNVEAHQADRADTLKADAGSSGSPESDGAKPPTAPTQSAEAAG